jgi:GDP-4-dehydro-6-deoxy-D-mannose reductase
MEHLRDRRIWVTGAGGFVGRHLVPALEQAGAQVTPTDDDLDIRDAALVAASLRRLQPHAIVHLAARSSVASSLQDAEGVYEVNFLGARALLTGLAQHCPAARILLVGSGVVYGSAEPGSAPFDESAPLRPDSPYAWTKACADLLGGSYAAQGLAVVRVRPFNHTGAGQSDRFIASAFAHQLAEIEAGRHEPVLRVGNLDSVRDFLAVEDVVDAYLRLLDPQVQADVYNVASGRGTCAREILDRLIEASSASPRIEVDPQRHRPTDVAVGSAVRLAAATGWKPRHDVRHALQAVLNHWRAASTA